MHFSVKLTMAGFFLTGVFQNVHAGSIDPISLLGNYNLITSGNVTSYSEMDGNALIGGDLSGGGNYHTHNTSTAVPALTVAGNIASGANVNVNGPGLIVGGSILGSVNMNNGGNAYAGSVASGGYLANNANGSGSSNVVGDIAGTVNTNGGNTVYGGSLTGNASANGVGQVLNQSVTPPVDAAIAAASAISTLTTFSIQLDSIAANGTYSLSGGTETFTATGDSNGLAVFTIADASSFFSNASEFQFNLTNVKDILINVINNDPSSELNIHANFLAGAATNLGADMLWNFENANNINVSAQFGGSMLALYANVTTSQNIEGTLVAASLTQYAEIHSQPLDSGSVTSLPGNVAPVPVPEPAAAQLCLSALAGFGAITSRRKVSA
jgi:choice-of-anchor A domain-containing protein